MTLAHLIVVTSGGLIVNCCVGMGAGVIGTMSSFLGVVLGTRNI